MRQHWSTYVFPVTSYFYHRSPSCSCNSLRHCRVHSSCSASPLPQDGWRYWSRCCWEGWSSQAGIDPNLCTPHSGRGRMLWPLPSAEDKQNKIAFPILKSVNFFSIKLEKSIDRSHLIIIHTDRIEIEDEFLYQAISYPRRNIFFQK